MNRMSSENPRSLSFFRYIHRLEFLPIFSRVKRFFPNLAAFLAISGALLHADPILIPDPINLLTQTQLLGDVCGCRPLAETNGVVVTLQSVSDILGNTTGGMSAGATYSGLMNLGVALDLNKAVGWEGASCKTTWIWLYGRDLSADRVGNALTLSGIAGTPAFRCYELWFQQNLLQDAVSLRGGMLGLDTEFMTSDTGSLFVNTTFGMASLLTLNFPNAGPTYPAGTPGLRLALQPLSWLTFRSAFTQANPFPQSSTQYGFNWCFGPQGGLLSLNEVEARWNKEPESKGLGGLAKAGFWIQGGNGTGSAPASYSFAPPSSTSYCSGFYGIVDQQLYRVKSEDSLPSGKNPAQTQQCSECSSKGLSGFLRCGFSPEFTTTTSLYSDAALVYTGLIPTRDKDRLGLAFAYAKVAPGLVNEASSQGIPGAGFEAVTELTYSIRLAPAIMLQPDLQYVLHPGGTQQYGNALVVGVRAVVDF